MSAPKKPLAQWASSINSYSATGRPWDGQPLTVSFAGDYFTPQSMAPAQGMNWLFNAMTGDTARLHTYVAPIPSLNWRAELAVGDLAPSGGSALFEMKYLQPGDTEPFTGCWIVAGNNATPHWKVYQSSDSGLTFAEVGSFSTDLGATNRCLSVAGTAKYGIPETVVGGRHNPSSSTLGIGLYTRTSGSWASKSADPHSSVYGAPTDQIYTHVVEQFASDGQYLAFGTIKTQFAWASYSVDNGATWTRATTNIDSFTSGQRAAILSADALHGYFSMVGATRCLVFPVASRTTQSAASYTYAYTSDGFNWFAGTIALGASEKPVCGAYDGTNAVYLLLTDAGKLYKSDNGATWTQTFAGTTFSASAVGTFGAMWLLTGESVTVDGQTVPQSIAYSLDAGVTWTGGAVPQATNVDYLHFRSSGGQLAAFCYAQGSVRFCSVQMGSTGGGVGSFL